MRDPDDKGHLIPNPETAPIVKNIFKWRANGIGPTEIANRLNELKILTPSAYKNINFSSRLIDRDNWNISTVRKILENRMYTGDLVQHTQTKVNYKSKKKITLNENLWVIAPNTHEALVDKDTFEYVNILRKRNTRNYGIKTKREKRLLEGKIYCKECTNRLTVLYRKKLDYWSINCNRYSRDPVRGRYDSHFFPYNYLEEQILKKFNKSISKLIQDLNVNELNNQVVNNIHKVPCDIDKNIQKYTIEKETITNKLMNLYNNYVEGILSAEVYKEISKKLEIELKQINVNIEEEQQKNIK